MRKILNVQVGDVFGDLKCVGTTYKKHPNGSGSNYYTMECMICGRRKDMLSSTIRKGHGITHKACGKYLKLKDKVFYNRWQAMRTRTTNPNYQHAKCYSEKGINSDEFKYFIDFYDKMYPSYRQLADKIGEHNVSLERIDNSKNYCVENCKWIYIKDQHKNTTRTVKTKAIYEGGHEKIYQTITECANDNNIHSCHVTDVMSGKIESYNGVRYVRV